MSGWLIIGGGYTGGRVAVRLKARGEQVWLTRRKAAEGVIELDVGTASVAQLAARIGEGMNVVVTMPPVDGEGTAEAKIARAAEEARARRIVYVSSTGVYAAAAGAWVDEDWPLEPVTASGRARLAAERAIAGGAVPAVALRAAGIHGPGRGALERMKAGTYRIIGSGDTHVSRVHVDDLAAAVVLAGDTRTSASAYNVADDDPSTSNEMARAASAALGLPMPPTVELAAVDGEIAGMFSADRRIDNRRLKDDLGWDLRWPSWRTVLESEVARARIDG